MLKIIAWANWLILQFFWIRVSLGYDDDTGEYLGWGILYLVAPMSGWSKPWGFWEEYVCFGEPKMFTLCRGLQMTYQEK